MDDGHANDVSVADILSNHMETKKAMQLTYVDDHHHNQQQKQHRENNNLNFNYYENSMEGFLPEQGDRDLSALEEFLAGTLMKNLLSNVNAQGNAYTC